MKVALYFFFSSKTLRNDSSCQPPALNETHDRCVSCIRHGSLQPHPFLSSTSSSRLILDGIPYRKPPGTNILRFDLDEIMAWTRGEK